MSKPVIPWLDKIGENDFVTDKLPYKENTYSDLFEQRIFETNDSIVGDLRYYVYDPTKHGYSANGTYPVIYSFHGSSASLQGITAINWAGIEYFASPEYQAKMGGAYIIVPLANEYMEKNEMKMSWMTPDNNIDSESAPKEYPEDLISSLRKILGENSDRVIGLLGINSIYTKYLHDLLKEAVAGFTSAGKTIITGTSAGGFCAWRYIISYPVDAALILAAGYLPSVKELELLEERKTKLWICHGRYDELVPFDLAITPIFDKLNSMENVSLFLPEFVRMPDYGIYSNPAGVEMGQHCINNAAQCDFMYNDNKPMDENHPEGITGWIREIGQIEFA